LYTYRQPIAALSLIILKHPVISYKDQEESESTP
jgi:hypothetical protein